MRICSETGAFKAGLIVLINDENLNIMAVYLLDPLAGACAVYSACNVKIAACSSCLVFGHGELNQLDVEDVLL